MIDLTEWQINFVREAIHKAIMLKTDSCYTEINKFADEFNKAYPCEGEEGE